MEKEEAYKVYGKKGGRLKADMSALLHENFEDTLRGKGWKGLQMFDKAHTVMLTEEGIIPEKVGIAILKALRQMEKEGVKEVRDSLGFYLHCGEAYVTKKLGPEVGGWIHCGRIKCTGNPSCFRCPGDRAHSLCQRCALGIK